MSEPKRVPVPEFEIVGPPCRTQGCDGVLVPTVHLKTKVVFQKCWKCQAEFDHMTAAEMVAWARRTFDRVLKDEKLS